MIPAGTEEQAGAIRALAALQIDLLGPRRFGAEDGIRRSTWWSIYGFGDAGYSGVQIITLVDERVAELRERMAREPDMISSDNVQLQLDMWVEVKAAISAITA